MNDLFSTSSLKRYTDLKHQTQIDDIEAGANVEMSGDLGPFFKEVESVKNDLGELEKLHRQLQDMNEEVKLASNAKTVKSLRSNMDNTSKQVLQRAKGVKSKLEALDRSNIAHRSEPGCGSGSSSDRTRMAVVFGLGKKLKDLMDEFQSLRGKISSDYKETVERHYFTVTGERPDDQTIEKLISTGGSETLMQQAIQKQGRGQVMDTVSEIQERHGAVQELEKSLMDLHQVFLDMAALVDAQGQQLNNIENHIAQASSFVRAGGQQLQEAKKLEKSSKKWMFYALGIILIVVAIIVAAVLLKPG